MFDYLNFRDKTLRFMTKHMGRFLGDLARSIMMASKEKDLLLETLRILFGLCASLCQERVLSQRSWAALLAELLPWD